MMHGSKPAKEILARAARVYHTNGAASVALGVHVATFGAWCRAERIETPHDRRIRMADEAEQARRMLDGDYTS